MPGPFRDTSLGLDPIKKLLNPATTFRYMGISHLSLLIQSINNINVYNFLDTLRGSLFIVMLKEPLAGSDELCCTA